MEVRELSIATGDRYVTDVTDHCDAFAHEIGGDGLMHVFLPHATAGLALLETGAGSDDDLAAHLATLLPRDDRWRHRHGAPGHGADHVLPAFISPSLMLPIDGGLIALGVWQRVVIVDTNGDNPRRTLRLSVLSG